ncbi:MULTISPECIES: DMT family transporter [Rhizobium/Agrobacterium group]|uniref:DMT family transporter n=1 Tax=Rhizobium/Agrobacterium group TaxID=227290 RepID=UPI000B3FEED3|nr:MULTISPECIES: DMT family transporter [Rhizobium/Agrobacterium group]MCF1482095.1 DMT family transporter [Allorhizobium ampelinum]MVA70779.1 EamA family transporter [Agrobacterium vitis]NSZ42128.1 DMT family transporter [Agrobacterium vitis]NTA25836.1 DMT family transporter [Allorhizobium ampelinum]OVE95926.1 EamA family transporter [Allorhizobium ampelinum]
MNSEVSAGPIRGPIRGIVFKVASVTVFVAMQTAIKLAGDDVPAGQITFYRSAFALIPILAYLAYLGQIRTGLRTANVFGHVKRGLIGIAAMACGFYGLVHLPMPDAIAIGYAMPLIAVVFAAVFLGETVRLYRWSAVAIGLVGVVIISWPKLTLLQDGFYGSEVGMGALAVLASATLGAAAMLQVRQLVREEKTATIVLYFSIIAALISLVSLPFGWNDLSIRQLGLLAFAGICGGLAQILLTESYRHADISTIAPFEYSSILFGSLIGYLLFDDLPSIHTLVGTLIVAGAGIFIILREHQLGLERRAARKASTPGV